MRRKTPMVRFPFQKHVETVEVIPATYIVPRAWDEWFWDAISENAPFSWGDNSRSLVDPLAFADHVETVCVDRAETLMDDVKTRDAVVRLLKRIRKIPAYIHIDLES